VISCGFLQPPEQVKDKSGAGWQNRSVQWSKRLQLKSLNSQKMVKPKGALRMPAEDMGKSQAQQPSRNNPANANEFQVLGVLIN